MPTTITTSQTIGPFSHEAWRWACESTAAVNSTAPTITIRGLIHDGAGLPIDDAMLEAWTPDAPEAEKTHALPGFRRIASDGAGAFHFELSRPQANTAGLPAAYITVFARGLGKHQFSAVFLEDDASLPASAILEQVPAERRHTLIARKLGDASYEWHVRMQGEQETVFFDYS